MSYETRVLYKVRSVKKGQPMPIIITLDVMLAKRKMRSKELAARIGITEQNISLLKSGKVKGVRFETLAKICDALDCQPGDLLIYKESDSSGDIYRTVVTYSVFAASDYIRLACFRMC